MRLLIIWEESGSRLRMYEELVTHDEFKAMSAAHGYLIGLCDVPALSEAALKSLARWLEGKTPFYDTEDKGKPIREVAACSIIHAGWVP